MLKSYLKCTLMIFFILLVGVLQAAEFTAVYTVITDFGATDEMTVALQPGERLVKSSAPLKSYRTRTIAVRNEEHLLELIGASCEAQLTDIQRGLLETYRISKNQKFAELGANLPANTAEIKLNLIDYPEHSAAVATVLDRETSGKLRAEDFYTILGNSRAVKKYVQERSAVQSRSVAAERAPNSSDSNKIVIDNNENPFSIDPN